MKLPETEKKAVGLFQIHGVLPTSRKCHNGHEGKLYLGKKMFWKCYVKNCQKKKVNVRQGTCFSRTGVSFVTAVHLTHVWLKNTEFSTLCKNNMNSTKISLKKKWNNYLRDLCLEEIEKSNVGKIIEVDDSLFYVSYDDELRETDFENINMKHMIKIIDAPVGTYVHNEGKLNVAQWRKKSHCGIACYFVRSKLAEFMWRQKNKGKNLFEEMLKTMKNCAPPAEIF